MLNKIAYFDCHAGAAGDMLLAATLDALRQEHTPDVPREKASDASIVNEWAEQMRSLLAIEERGRFELSDAMRCGIHGLKIDFFVGETNANHVTGSGHHHRHLSSINKILEEKLAALGNGALQLSKDIFETIGRAEARVHGTSIEKVHFHEVGAFDSIMDIAGFALALSLLKVDKVYASRVTLGSGTFSAAHGVLAVPPPAVVEILKDTAIPVSDISLEGECLTPTGAGILGTVVDQWDDVPAMDRILAQGVGAGTRDNRGMANVVRLIVGESPATTA